MFLGLAGATPLFLSDEPELSFTDAVFEAVSGFTTTGATVIVGLDYLPKSILYYRQQIQWFGGMGIIVLAVAILPGPRHRRHVALQGRDARADEGPEADAAHHPDGEGALGRSTFR